MKTVVFTQFANAKSAVLVLYQLLDSVMCMLLCVSLGGWLFLRLRNILPQRIAVVSYFWVFLGLL